MNIAEFRSQYPQYDQVSDFDLAKGLHQKFYSDVSFDKFTNAFIAPAYPDAETSSGQIQPGISHQQRTDLADLQGLQGQSTTKFATGTGSPADEAVVSAATDNLYAIPTAAQLKQMYVVAPVQGIRSSAAKANTLIANAVDLLDSAGKGYGENLYGMNDLPKDNPLTNIVDYFRGQAQAVAPTREELSRNGDVISQIMRGLAQAPGDIATYALASAATGSPAAGMGIIDALANSEQGDATRAAKVGMQSVLMGGVLHGAQGLALPQRMGTMAGIGGGQAALEGGNLSDVVSGAVTMGALGYSGGREGMTFREALDSLKTPQEKIAFYKDVKTEADTTGKSLDEIAAERMRQSAEGATNLKEELSRMVQDAGAKTETVQPPAKESPDAPIIRELMAKNEGLAEADAQGMIDQLRQEMLPPEVTPKTPEELLAEKWGAKLTRETPPSPEPTAAGAPITREVQPGLTEIPADVYEEAKATGRPIRDILAERQSASAPAPNRRADIILREQVQSLASKAAKGDLDAQQQLEALTLEPHGSGLPNELGYRMIPDEPGVTVAARTRGDEFEAKKDGEHFFMDLDNFKKINTENGHAGGDQVLAFVGRALKDFANRGLSLNDMGKQLQDFLSRATVEVETADGATRTVRNIGTSYGIGKTREAADAANEINKNERKAAGLRDDRGESTVSPAPERGGTDNFNNAPRPDTGAPKDTTASQVTELHSGIHLPKGIETALASLNQSKIVQGLKSLLLPSSKSPEHLAAAEVLGAKMGEMNRQGDVAAKVLAKDSRDFDRLGVHNSDILPENNPGVKFMSDMSRGRSMPPRLEAVANKIKGLFEIRIKQIQELGTGALQTVRENYFPGMWEKDSIRAFNQALSEFAERRQLGTEFDANSFPRADRAEVRQRTEELLKQGQGADTGGIEYLSKRPLEGQKSFTKQKVFDDIMTGVEFGLKPVSNNPIDIAKLKMAEMDRYIMANRALNQWTAEGSVLESSPGEKVPAGWIRVNGAFSKYIAKKPVADVLNNYLSQTLHNNEYVGGLYKGWMGAANTLNQAQLGVGSAFHAGFTTAETVYSGLANNMKDMYRLVTGQGSLKQVVSGLQHTLTAPVSNPMAGDVILKEWNNPGSQSSKVQAIVRAAELAGAKIGNEKGLQTGQLSKSIREWQSGEWLSAALRSPVAFTELAAKPIMEMLVPRQKLGVFGELAQRIIDNNPGKSLEQLTPQFRQAWNRVDARLGQVSYDRLFMNNASKNVIQAVVRAPGWSGGTIAEIGGSVKDTGKFVKQWITEGKPPAELPDRVAYTLSLLVGSAVINGALTYAFTGEKPKDMDYWAFRTGGTAEQGRPERMVLPTYAKDVFAYAQNPGRALTGKATPLLSVIADTAIHNKDFYGVEIRHTGDPAEQQIFDVAKYGIKQFVPFWMRGAQKEVERGGGWQKTLTETPAKLIAPQLGVMPATSEYTNTPAEKLMNEYIRNKLPVGARTKEQFEASQFKSDALRYLRGGKGREMPIEMKQQLMSLSDKDLDHVISDAQISPLQAKFKRLTAEEAADVYRTATPEQQAELKAGLLDKVYNHYDSLSEKDRPLFINKIKPLFQAQRR